MELIHIILIIGSIIIGIGHIGTAQTPEEEQQRTEENAKERAQ